MADAPDTLLWYNPRCSKCREAKARLDEQGIAHRVRHYLEEPPCRAELEAILARLPGGDVREIVRSKEDAYRALGLAKAGREALLDAIVAHPVLLERPILVRGERAIVARPPERVDELL